MQNLSDSARDEALEELEERLGPGCGALGTSSEHEAGAMDGARAAAIQEDGSINQNAFEALAKLRGCDEALSRAGTEAGELRSSRRRFRMVSTFSRTFDGRVFDDVKDLIRGRLVGSFTVAFKAKWEKLNAWSRIIDIGTGVPTQDNIIIANKANSDVMTFYVYRGRAARGLEIPGAVKLHELSRWMMTVTRTGQMSVWKDGKLLKQRDDGFAPLKVYRKHFYVGKSHWYSDELFQGEITDLYMWRGAETNWTEHGGGELERNF